MELTDLERAALAMVDAWDEMTENDRLMVPEPLWEAFERLENTVIHSGFRREWVR